MHFLVNHQKEKPTFNTRPDPGKGHGAASLMSTEKGLELFPFTPVLSLLLPS